MSCGAWSTTLGRWPKRTLPPTTRSGNEQWATACRPFKSADSESRHPLFRSRLGGCLCSWDQSYNLDSSTFRHKERRTDGGACHVGGDRSFGSLGGRLSHHTDFMGPAACRRPGRPWSFASCGIYSRPLDQRVYDHSVSCGSGPGCGNGVCRDACSFCPHAASRGEKINLACRSTHGG